VVRGAELDPVDFRWTTSGRFHGSQETLVHDRSDFFFDFIYLDGLWRGVWEPGEGTPRMGRIDWWNLFAGAVINLALAAIIPPQVVQGVLSMAAHGLGALYGGFPPALP
jgi:hypothetical protein